MIKISTFLVLIGMIIVTLYGIIEVSYYASADNVLGNNSETPYLEIPSLGIDQAVNNKSIDYGIYHDPRSSKPSYGTVAIFGHRTFNGSPFLNLDKLQSGDNITVEWPGIGNVEYKVLNTTIVPASYMLSVDQGNVLFLITCYPLGSDKERLMIEAKQENVYPIIKSDKKPENDSFYAILIIIGFFASGSILSYFYPIRQDQYLIFVATITITIILIYTFLFPSSPDTVESKLSWFNDLLGV